MCRTVVVLVAVVAACGRIDFAPIARDAIAEIDGPSGAWQFVSTQPGTPATSSGPAITSSAGVSAGDLVIPMCRGNVGADPPTLQLAVAPSSAVTLAPVLQRWDPTSLYWNAFTYGVIAPGTPPGTTVSFTSATFTGPADCLVSVFHGGLAAPALVDMVSTTGGAGGMVTCGPIDTAVGGVAIYSSTRSNCSDAPLAGPFVQLGTDFGNPWGAWAPADGTPGSATLTDCGNSGGWICSAISLSP